MSLNLDKPIQIKTGYLAEMMKTGSHVEILSLTFRLSERAVLVEYRIAADDNSGRDHHNAVVVPIDSLPKGTIKGILKDIYNQLKQLPGMSGSVTDDAI